MSFLKSILKLTPISTQNLAITMVNTKLYKTRHGKLYKLYRNYYQNAESLSQPQIEE